MLNGVAPLLFNLIEAHVPKKKKKKKKNYGGGIYVFPTVSGRGCSLVKCFRFMGIIYVQLVSMSCSCSNRGTCF